MIVGVSACTGCWTMAVSPLSQMAVDSDDDIVEFTLTYGKLVIIAGFVIGGLAGAFGGFKLARAMLAE